MCWLLFKDARASKVAFLRVHLLRLSPKPADEHPGVLLPAKVDLANRRLWMVTTVLLSPVLGTASA
jgi:hypothetical protein